MQHHPYSPLVSAVFLLAILLTACQPTAPEPVDRPTTEDDKREILRVLNAETAAAFQRDYGAWQRHWVHDSSVTKVYVDLAHGECSESVGWTEISTFVRDFMDEHPDPEPVPDLLNDISVRSYESGAWVIFEQVDSLRGRKRETRLMEKVGDEWKIAGMQTTIYGF